MFVLVFQHALIYGGICRLSVAIAEDLRLRLPKFRDLWIIFLENFVANSTPPVLTQSQHEGRQAQVKARVRTSTAQDRKALGFEAEKAAQGSKEQSAMGLKAEERPWHPELVPTLKTRDRDKKAETHSSRASSPPAFRTNSAS